MNIRNIAFILASIGFLLAGAGIGYYYGIYLPNKKSSTDIMIEQGYQSAKKDNIKSITKCNKLFDKEASIGCMKFANEEKEKEDKKWTEDSDFTREIKQKIEDYYIQETQIKREIDDLQGNYTFANLLSVGEKIYKKPSIHSDMLYYIFGKEENPKIIDSIYRVCVSSDIFSCNIRLPNDDLYETYLLQDVSIQVPQPYIDLYYKRLQDFINTYNKYKNGEVSLKYIHDLWTNYYGLK